MSVQVLLQDFIYPLLLGFIISMMLDIFVKRMAFHKIGGVFDFKEVNLLRVVPWSIIHTYGSSYLYKQNIKYARFKRNAINDYFKGQLKSIFIRRANSYNLMASAILFLLVVFISCFAPLDSKGFWWLCLSFFIYIRTVSRSLEIIYAFVMDVVTRVTKQTSSLNKFDRIKLALTSYIENIINFTLVYALLSGPNLNTLQSLFDSIGRSSISNVNITTCSGLILQAFTYLQVFTSMTLVVLSLAVYIGRKY